ncbi:diguanylate cyclase domain-containing protein [Desulfonatronum thiodismutans]|uniref:diguanylate cyclase domain-containing protein n=1 Tax=Desulfonatronum thiodismutans TaxID=159290 RepID=UPI0004ABD58F|nr:diguanylate cyclase [Desulfonatronum thiodismutans]
MPQNLLASFSNPRILIIDDEQLFRDAVSDYLKEQGFKTHTAANGRSGLEAFQKFAPHAVLVDLRMEEVDGLEVVASVVKESPETPCIVVSGTGVLQDAIEALRIGASDYVTKPVQDLEALVHVVRRCLERARLQQENRLYRERLEEQVTQRTAELRSRTMELEEVNSKLLAEITERKRVEKLIAKAKKEWETTFDSVSDHVSIVGPDFRFLRVNKTLAAHHGMHPREMIGMLCLGIIGCMDLGASICPHKTFIEEAGKSAREQIIHCQELDQWDYLSTTPLYNDGEYIGTLLVYRDVTERVRTEKALKESENRFRLLAENATDMVTRLSPGGDFIYVSPSCQTILGFAPQTLVGKSLFDFIHSDCTSKAAACLREETCRFVCRMHTISDAYVWLDISTKLLRDAKTGVILEVQASSRDITEAIHAQEALQRSNEKFSKAFHTSLDGFAIVNIDNATVLEANPSFAQTLDLDHGKLVGMSLESLPCWLTKADQQRLRRELDDKREVRDFEAILHTLGGEEVFVQLSASFLELQQEPCIIYSLKNITSQKLAEKEIKFMAMHDQLTGLPNRRLFLDRFEQTLNRARRYGEKACLMFVDLDAFKEINDEMGHQIGDAVLKETAMRLEKCVRKSDTVARIGGDEFVLILGGQVEAQQVENVARKITRELSKDIVAFGYQCAISASIGISLFPGDGQSLDVLMQKADAAMYQAKKAGGDMFLFYSFDTAPPQSTAFS